MTGSFTGKLVTDNLFRAEEAISKVALSYLGVRKKVPNPPTGFITKSTVHLYYQKTKNNKKSYR